MKLVDLSKPYSDEMMTSSNTRVQVAGSQIKPGKSLSQLPLERFMGQARVVEVTETYFPPAIGLIFIGGEINLSLLKRIERAKPLFVGVGSDAETDSNLTAEMEYELLAKDIVLFANLVNLDLLPKGTEFIFMGLPLNIKEGDSSPVRAVALVNE